jgi:hypothetical protein
LVAIAALAALALAGFVALPWLIIVPVEPMQADVLLQWAIGPHPDSDVYVAQLYHQGSAKEIVCASSPVSWEVYPADYVRQHLITLNVPAEHISVLHLPITDCGAEALALLVEHVKAREWKSALLVVDPAGSRFSQWLAQRYFGREGIRVAITYAPHVEQELRHQWWRTHWKIQRITSAVVGTALDLLYPQCR